MVLSRVTGSPVFRMAFVRNSFADIAAKTFQVTSP